MEESFVLLKPDALNSIKIRKKIFDLLKNQLDIFDQKKFIYLKKMLILFGHIVNTTRFVIGL